MSPKDLDYSRLHDLFSRYAAGEEFSPLNKEWALDVHRKVILPPSLSFRQSLPSLPSSSSVP